MFSCPPPLSPADCDSYCKASKGKLKINMKKYCKKDYGELPSPSTCVPVPAPSRAVALWVLPLVGSGDEALAGGAQRSSALHVKPLAPHRCWDSPKPQARHLHPQVSAGLRRCPALFSWLLASGVGPKCSPVAPWRWSGWPRPDDPSPSPALETGPTWKNWRRGIYAIYVYTCVYKCGCAAIPIDIIFPKLQCKKPHLSASQSPAVQVPFPSPGMLTAAARHAGGAVVPAEQIPFHRPPHAFLGRAPALRDAPGAPQELGQDTGLGGKYLNPVPGVMLSTTLLQALGCSQVDSLLADRQNHVSHTWHWLYFISSPSFSSVL